MNEHNLLIMSNSSTIYDALRTKILNGKKIHCTYRYTEIERYTLKELR